MEHSFNVVKEDILSTAEHTISLGIGTVGTCMTKSPPVNESVFASPQILLSISRILVQQILFYYRLNKILLTDNVLKYRYLNRCIEIMNLLITY